jgi:hypothetical protein
MKVRKAVIPAAGYGTRFLPIAKAVPKEMLPLVDKPVIQHVVEEAVASGITDILIVISRSKRAIEEHFHPAFDLESELAAKGRTEDLEALRRLQSMARVHFIWQPKMGGLGDALLYEGSRGRRALRCLARRHRGHHERSCAACDAAACRCRREARRLRRGAPGGACGESVALRHHGRRRNRPRFDPGHPVCREA